MPERLVISNTTPLLYLHRIQRLSLLRQLYQQVQVPPAVVTELQLGRTQGHDVPALQDHDWLKQPHLPADAPAFNVPDLGPGEAEVLALAVRNPGCLILMDDALGRQIARLNRVTMTGTGGILLRAKRQGLLPSLRETLDQLLAAGFWLDEETQHLLLAQAGEL